MLVEYEIYHFIRGQSGHWFVEDFESSSTDFQIVPQSRQNLIPSYHLFYLFAVRIKA